MLTRSSPPLPGREMSHTAEERFDLEADGTVCLGYANGRDGEHEHWPMSPQALQPTHRSRY